MKVVENSPQNPRNCTILKKFLGGACPQTPLAQESDYIAATPLTQQFSNVFLSHYYKKLIHIPTRVAGNTQSLLENLYTNDPLSDNSGVLTLSDPGYFRQNFSKFRDFDHFTAISK